MKLREGNVFTHFCHSVQDCPQDLLNVDFPVQGLSLQSTKDPFVISASVCNPLDYNVLA